MSIVVEDYHKTYGDFVAVDGLSFRVEPGEIMGLIGPNGAGKTTTLRALAGILRPTQGRLLIAGHDIVRDPVAAKSNLTYVPDEPPLFDRLTVWEHFRFVAAVYRVADWEPRGAIARPARTDAETCGPGFRAVARHEAKSRYRLRLFASARRDPF